MRGYEREVALQGAVNFRDAGGYAAASVGRVRRRWLFRSDALHELTRDDVARVCHELGVRTVIDLRSDWEAAACPAGLLAVERGVTTHHMPLVNGTQPETNQDREPDLATRYARMLRMSAGTIRGIVELVVNSSAPTVVHCAAGKDRTGVITALLLAAVGVADDDIVADYALSGRNLRRVAARLRAMPEYDMMLSALPKGTQHARPDTMNALLSGLRGSFGSVDGYLRHCGLSADTLVNLRQRLVQDEQLAGSNEGVS